MPITEDYRAFRHSRRSVPERNEPGHSAPDLAFDPQLRSGGPVWTPSRDQVSVRPVLEPPKTLRLWRIVANAIVRHANRRTNHTAAKRSPAAAGA